MSADTYTSMAADTANYLRDCFSVRILKQFDTFEDIVRFSEQDPENGKGDGTDGSIGAVGAPSLQALNNISTDGSNGLLPQYFSRRLCRDTTLGGNDVLNPLPQFNEDDDIVHPHYYSNLQAKTGMGSVYKEMYNDTQQIVYASFGLPVFNKLSYFYTNAIDPDMAKAMNQGSGFTMSKFGYLIGKSLSLLIMMPTIPLMFLNRIYGGLTDVLVTRYYEFVERMPLYFRFVNTIMINLSVNMKMLSTGLTNSTKSEVSATGSTSSGAQYQTLYQNGAKDMSGLPDIFSTFDLDITKIVARRYLYEKIDIGLNGTFTDEFIDTTDLDIPLPDQTSTGAPTTASPVGSQTAPPGSPNQSTNPSDGTSTVTSDSGVGVTYTQNMLTGFKNALYRGHLFIGFRVEKGLDSSESFSNQTGESAVARALNSQFETGQSARFTTAEGNLAGGALGDLASSVWNAVSGLASGLAQPFGVDALAAVATGSAKVDVPDVWMNSSYSKDISFRLECRAPYADPVTILKTEYLPLACWLAAVLPRATGQNSWTSPFIARMYSKGFFASPLCMVTGLTVERGGDQNGWSAQRLPLKTVMTVNVKDLSPVMYMYMGSTLTDMQNLIGANSIFNDYLMTLSGMGLVDQLTPQEQMWRKAVIFGKSVWGARLNPFELGMELGDRLVVSKLISMILPGNLLPSN